MLLLVYNVIYLFLAVLLLRLELSKPFITIPTAFTKSSTHLLRLNVPNGEDFVRNELFSEGLDLWNKFFVSTQQWDIVDSSNITINFTASLNTKSIKEIISELRRNSWMLIIYPMLPDLIVDKVRKNPMNEEEIEPTVDFFLNQRLYRQLACLMSIQSDPPITADHFQRPSINALIRTMEYSFKLRPGRVEDLFEPMQKGKMFLVAPLIACSKQDPQIIRNVLRKVFPISKLQMVAQVCAGIMFTDFDSLQYTQSIFDRNENLIKFMGEELFTDPSADIRAALKACHVMNLIKLNPSSTQNILFAIYLDESEETVANTFRILSKVAALSKNDYYQKLVQSFNLRE